MLTKSLISQTDMMYIGIAFCPLTYEVGLA